MHTCIHTDRHRCIHTYIQVKSGTIFDDIILTDSIEEANAFAKETFYKKKEGEKAMFDKVCMYCKNSIVVVVVVVLCIYMCVS